MWSFDWRHKGEKSNAQENDEYEYLVIKIFCFQPETTSGLPVLKTMTFYEDFIIQMKLFWTTLSKPCVAGQRPT